MTALEKGLCLLCAFFMLLLAACVPVTPVPSPTTTATATLTATATFAPSATAGPTSFFTSTITPTPVIGLCSPLAVTPWTDLWKIDWNPFNMPSHYDGTKFRDNGHPGVDLVYYSRYGRPGIMGEGVQSVLDGRIASVIKNRMPYGNMVMTETPYDRIPPDLLALVPIPVGDSLYVVYAHLRDPASFEPGEPVRCGEAFGRVGMSGMATGPHLHFETRWGPPGASFASMSYYTADYTDEEVKNYVLWRMSGIYVPFDPMTLLTLKQPLGAARPTAGAGQ